MGTCTSQSHRPYSWELWTRCCHNTGLQLATLLFQLFILLVLIIIYWSVSVRLHTCLDTYGVVGKRQYVKQHVSNSNNNWPTKSNNKRGSFQKQLFIGTLTKHSQNIVYKVYKYIWGKSDKGAIVSAAKAVGVIRQTVSKIINSDVKHHKERKHFGKYWQIWNLIRCKHWWSPPVAAKVTIPIWTINAQFVTEDNQISFTYKGLL